MRVAELSIIQGRCLIDCTILQELEEAIHNVRNAQRNSVLADLGDEKIAALSGRLRDCHLREI